MSLSTFMQFGRESDIAAKDVGQPKFRLTDARSGESFYVLLGSLHMPSESAAVIAEAERHVNQTALRTLLINTLSCCVQHPLSLEERFQYVRRTPCVDHARPELRRIAHP